MLVRDEANRHHVSASATTQAGMNPSFLFLQVFENLVLQRKTGGHEPDTSLLALPKNEVSDSSSRSRSRSSALQLYTFVTNGEDIFWFVFKNRNTSLNIYCNF